MATATILDLFFIVWLFIRRLICGFCLLLFFFVSEEHVLDKRLARLFDWGRVSPYFESAPRHYALVRLRAEVGVLLQNFWVLSYLPDYVGDSEDDCFIPLKVRSARKR